MAEKITGPNTAAHQIQIPVMDGRDTTEARFYTEGGKEYMQIDSSLYVSESNVKPLETGQSSKVTLQSNGHAKWFTIPYAAERKTMTVELPSKSSFAVYDEKGVCVNFTVVSNNNKVKLPKERNGCICWRAELGIYSYVELATIQDELQQNQQNIFLCRAGFVCILRITFTKRLSTNNITLKLLA